MYGSWKGSASSSKPYGLWVLGGSGGDPAFVSPIEKDYNWDETMPLELDNTFAIGVTSANTTTVSGTTNWGAGADGGFWNYLYKNTKAEDLQPYYGTDLSEFYDQIPKGESTFSLDVATLTVTFGKNNHQAKVLPPGTHSFVNNKSLEVPAGCFALDFHLQDASIPKTSFQYRDIDRLVFAPIEYVIIFAKE